MTMPEPVAQLAWTNADEPVWRCTVTVRKRRKEVTEQIHGSLWTDAIINAFDYLGRLIPDEEEGDWETAEGLPAWIVFPKIVSTAWGHASYRKIWGMVKAEDRKFQEKIERRRALREARDNHG